MQSLILLPVHPTGPEFDQDIVDGASINIEGAIIGSGDPLPPPPPQEKIKIKINVFIKYFCTSKVCHKSLS